MEAPHRAQASGTARQIDMFLIERIMEAAPAGVAAIGQGERVQSTAFSGRPGNLAAQASFSAPRSPAARASMA